MTRNEELCMRFPFLNPEPENAHFDFGYTILDSMPSGWRKAFGEQMCEEICAALREDEALSQYKIVEIKEKYGCLCWYDHGGTEKTKEIVHKYEGISRKTCIVCGQPATWLSVGWVEPLCDRCVKPVTLRCDVMPFSVASEEKGES